jgi:2-polyprenyl-3-methyl-5-hydroxy-6-metoxy-1,4-benzoquinol methylase
MKVEYDKYYETENLFGNPYPELMDFYAQIEQKGKLLDLGCGQGRDAIPLAKLGFSVTGIDNSIVGIEQLNEIATKDNLFLKGIVMDVYSYSAFDEFDFILLDSMFHFGKKERQKEIDFLNRLINLSKPNTLITICIQKVGKKVAILNEIISNQPNLDIIHQTELIYLYEDKTTNHRSETKYKMVTIKKVLK